MWQIAMMLLNNEKSSISIQEGQPPRFSYERSELENPVSSGHEAVRGTQGHRRQLCIVSPESQNRQGAGLTGTTRLHSPIWPTA
jgi:hypothetical protein